MVGSVWPKSDLASQHLCRTMGANFGKVSDWTQGRHACGAGKKRDEILKKGDDDDRYKEMLKDDYNLAWKAIQKNAFLQADQKLAELFMTLSGTLISRQKGDRKEIVTLPSLTDQEILLKALLEGGEVSIYVCDTKDKCLAPREGKITVTQAFQESVKEMLVGMVDKILIDEPLKPHEQGFLNATKLPIYKILNVLTAYKKGQGPLHIEEYTELIALDILHQYIIEVLTLVNEGLAQMRITQVDDSEIKELQKQLSLVRKRLVERRHSAFEKLNATLSLIQKTQFIERQLHHQMGTLASEERD